MTENEERLEKLEQILHEQRDKVTQLEHWLARIDPTSRYRPCKHDNDPADCAECGTKVEPDANPDDDGEREA